MGEVIRSCPLARIDGVTGDGCVIDAAGGISSAADNGAMVVPGGPICACGAGEGVSGVQSKSG